MDNSTDIPNLFDLVESIGSTDTADWLIDFTVASNDKVLSLVGHSVCADGGGDGVESDARLKADIEQVGTTVYGLPLYHFRYIDGAERFEGVMAQDVLEVMPDAVSIGSNGFYRVNYRKLGIEMTGV